MSLKVKNNIKSNQINVKKLINKQWLMSLEINTDFID